MEPEDHYRFQKRTPKGLRNISKKKKLIPLPNL
jgi:hypothetical protein